MKKHLINDLVTPIGAFLKLKNFQPVFLFESVERSGTGGRFSFIGLSPQMAKSIDWADLQQTSFSEQMRDLLRKNPGALPTRHRIPAGLVGMTSFEMLHHFNGNKSPFAESAFPAALFTFPQIIITFDHRNHSISIQQPGVEEPDEKLEKEILAALRSQEILPAEEAKFSFDKPQIDQAELKNRILKAREYIHKDELYQLVLSDVRSGKTNIKPFQLYRAMRHSSPSPYLFYINIGDYHAVGSSPETMARLDDDQLVLRPVSGISPRSDKQSTNEKIRQELLQNEEEIAKQIFFVDKAVSICSELCQPDSIEVNKMVSMEKYSQEIHLKSEITGKLKDNRDQFDVFEKIFPAGTVIGAPQTRAAEVIAELEGEARGLYGGSVGYFSNSGSMDHAIAVKTVVFNGECFTTRAGSAITSDTDPDQAVRIISDKLAETERVFDVARDNL